jgi:hypothetical protein
MGALDVGDGGSGRAGFLLVPMAGISGYLVWLFVS